VAVYGYAYNSVGTRPSAGPQPGTRALLNHGIAHFGASNLGIYNPRDVCGNLWPNIRCALSFHAEGRAGDAGYRVDRKRWPKGHPDGSRFAAWLIANANELGVQEVIWAGHRWDVRTRKWVEYTGRSDHFDHVHFSQCWAAARGLTAADIDAISNPKPAPTPEPAPEPEDDDVRRIIKGDKKPEWYLTDGITKRHIRDRGEAGAIAVNGLGQWDNGQAFVWPQEYVDRIASES
jgi:hypothetical protein